MTPRLLSIIVPAYNEERRIRPTLESIEQYCQAKQQPYEILVIDDGCKDKTVEVVTAIGSPHIRILNYGENRGKGYAVNYGMLHATGDWLLMTDADSSTPIAEYEKLIAFASDYQVIIGSRYTSGSTIAAKQPLSRVVLSRLGNLLCQAILLPGINDTQCGFKLFSREAAQTIFPKQTVWRWGFDMEILRIAREKKYMVKEVGITWYNDELTRLASRSAFTQTLGELFTIRKQAKAGLYR